MVDFIHSRKINRPQRRAMISLAACFIGWIALVQVKNWWSSDLLRALDHPPQLFIELHTASEEELQLLPDVGEKTAKTWRRTLDESPFLSPRHAKELESLPAVGPIRSSKLAPFLVESDSRSITSLDSTVEADLRATSP